MTKEQLEELKTEVASTVRVVVNGKIDAIDKKFDAYVMQDMQWKETVDEFMVELTPVKDGVHAVQSINKFFKWIGLSSIGAVILYWFAK